MRRPAGRTKILLLLRRSRGREAFPSPIGGRTVRRVTILIAIAAVSLVVGGGAAMAATVVCDGGRCSGTNRSDSIFGTDRHDAVFAKRGADFVTGRESADNLNGQDGNDDVFGGMGDDWVK